MNRRHFLHTTLVATIAASVTAAGKRAPRILLRSSWQTINIGDIGHTPRVLALIEKHLPEAEVRLWPGDVSQGVREMLVRRFPKLRIWEMQVKGPQLDQWPTRGHTLLYGNLAPEQISRANIPERLGIFAANAFRRPLRPGELAPIEKLVTAKLDAGMKPLDALQLGFEAILCSPARSRSASDRISSASG